MSLAMPSYAGSLLGQTFGALAGSSRSGAARIPTLYGALYPAGSVAAPGVSAATDMAAHLQDQQASAQSAVSGLDTVRKALAQAKELSLAMEKASGADLADLGLRYGRIRSSVSAVADELKPLGNGFKTDYMGRRIHALVTESVNRAGQALSTGGGAAGTAADLASADQQVQRAARSLEELASQVQKARRAVSALENKASPIFGLPGGSDASASTRAQAVALLAGLSSYRMGARVFSTLA